MIHRFAEQGADDGIRRTRLIHDSGTKVIVSGPEYLEAVLQGGISQRWSSGDDDTGWLSTGMRIDNVDPLVCCRHFALLYRTKTL
jgi:hypothetical protein